MDQIKDFQTLRTLERGSKAPNNNNFVPVNMWFDTNFDLRRKAEMVAGGNMPGSRDKDYYCGVINIGTVSTDILFEYINDLEVDVTDVENAYLHGFTKDKICTRTWTEFGEWEGQVLFCVRWIYGLNTSMARWHEALLDNLKLIWLCTSRTYPKIWMRDVRYHYEYITIYSYNLLLFRKNPTGILRGLNTLFPLKGVGYLNHPTKNWIICDNILLEYQEEVYIDINWS